MRARHIQALIEEYECGFVGAMGKYYEVFVNPSPKECRAVAKTNRTLRFIADSKTKKIYVSHWMQLHVDVWDRVKDENDRRGAYDPSILTGYAEEDQPVWRVSSLSSGLKMTHTQFCKLYRRFEWINRYLDLEQFHQSHCSKGGKRRSIKDLQD